MCQQIYLRATIGYKGLYDDRHEDDVKQRLEGLDHVDEGDRSRPQRHDRHALAEAMDHGDWQNGLDIRHADARHLAQTGQPERSDPEHEADPKLQRGNCPRQVQILEHSLVVVVVRDIDDVPEQKEDADCRGKRRRRRRGFVSRARV